MAEPDSPHPSRVIPSPPPHDARAAADAPENSHTGGDGDAWGSVTLDIRGEEFSLPTSLLSLHRSTMLGAMFASDNASMLQHKERYVFDRDPVVFRSVYDYYMTGVLLPPQHVPEAVVLFEWDFWGLAAPPLPSILSSEEQRAVRARADDAVEAIIDLVRPSLVFAASGELPEVVFTSQVWSRRWIEVASGQLAELARIAADQASGLLRTHSADGEGMDAEAQMQAVLDGIYSNRWEGVTDMDSDFIYRQQRNIRMVSRKPSTEAAATAQQALCTLYARTACLANCKLTQHLLKRALFRMGLTLDIAASKYIVTERPNDTVANSLPRAEWVVGWRKEWRALDADGYYPPLPLSASSSASGRHLRIVELRISNFFS
jgi:hypothetical protein